MTGADDDWAAEAQRIAAKPLRARDEIHLRYAIGKYFDDVKNFEQAFINYRRANELAKLSRASHDREQVKRAFDAIAQHYDRAWVEQARNWGSPSIRPVFVVGMPRSGTSLAEQILASHPRVFGAGELPYWQNAAARMAASAPRDEPGESASRALAENYMRLLTDMSTDAERVVDKMPGNFIHLGLIHAALPQARIVHLQRNPLDTCLSIYFQNFHRAHTYANDLEDLAHYYSEYLRIMEHWRSVLPADAILDVPYESLVDEQEVWSRKMIEFIGLSWDPACIDFHKTSRRVNTFSKWQVRQKISRSSVERWRNYAPFIRPLMRLAEAPALVDVL
jgi:hypothetical protein